MTIFNGNRKIGNIYHGDRKIGKVFKGTELIYSATFDLIGALLAGDITLAEAKQQGLIDDYELVTNCNSAFKDDLSLVNVGYVDAQCTDLSEMYRECSNLESIIYIDTSSATSINRMFFYCSSLTTAPHLNTSSVTNMSYMFYYCKSLTSIPELDTSSVTNMYNMFRGCSSLTTVPVMDTSSVTNMYRMFYECSLLTTVPVMDTSSVTNMTGMFYHCSSLTEVTFTGTQVPPFGDNIFTGTGITTTTGSIYVPDYLYDQWIIATNWVRYADIIKKESERP